VRDDESRLFDRHENVGVLVVDDMPMFRGAAGTVIECTPGFWLVGEASSGEEAIGLVTQHAPDLVLLDVHMPKLDGVATAHLIAETKCAPITVLLSADQHPNITADPHAHGAAAFLLKQQLGPHTLRELWAAHGISGGPGRPDVSLIDVDDHVHAVVRD
jgi:DNA-binding NarL/FixJ family response regulator